MGSGELPIAVATGYVTIAEHSPPLLFTGVTLGQVVIIGATFITMLFTLLVTTLALHVWRSE